MDRKRVRLRIIKDKGFRAIVVLFSFVSIVPLLFILYFIIKNGILSLSWDFFTELPKPVGEKGGGISNAIIGSFVLVLIASIPAIPLGVAAGTYISEHRGSKLAYWGRVAVEVLQGTPSIVIGIIAYLWVVVSLGGFSALSGGVALGIMMLPMIITTTEETLRLIPESLKEASLALGVPYYRTILRVVLPAGVSGITTGVLISVARIVGETAPLLFTAFGNAFMNWNFFKPVNALPLLIYNYATSPYPEWHAAAWGASCVLVGFVLVLNLFARVVTRRWKVLF
ncbi:MAG: phosphate ABC transporter permease PstA [Desulfobacteraceae bacterium]|jgi:phosphate transport system permease protein